MINPFSRAKTSEAAAKLAALDKSLAVIEFAMDGTILTANENFLKAMGYTLAEVKASSTACSWSRLRSRARLIGNSGRS